MAAIPTDAETLVSNSRCYACIPPEMRRPVLIYVLATLAGLGAQTPTQLVAAAKCYLGMDANIERALELYLLNVIAGGSSPCGSLSGIGDPTGNQTPDFSGQLYHDTDGDTWWYSTGTTSADWTQIPTGGGPCANVEGAGDPT